MTGSNTLTRQTDYLLYVHNTKGDGITVSNTFNKTTPVKGAKKKAPRLG